MTERTRLLAPHRLVIGGAVVLLATVALVAARGPAWLQRLYHPLVYQSEIRRSAARFRIDPYLVAGVIQVESGFKPAQVSRHGAVGLMQVLPSTAEEVRNRHEPVGFLAGRPVLPEDLKDPATNIDFGTAYLGELLRQFDDTRTALAAYNAGPATVDKWLKRPGGKKIAYVDVAFPETKSYVKRVLLEVYLYRRLYPEAFR